MPIPRPSTSEALHEDRPETQFRFRSDAVVTTPFAVQKEKARYLGRALHVAGIGLED